jgi:serine/threonine protein kinase
VSLAPNAVRSLGRYELIRRLAADNLAEIYLAQHARKSSKDKLVVVKRMLPQAAKDGALVEKFLTEARLAAQLDHPNIVRIEKIDVDADSYYYAMEYVQGADLRQILQGLAHRNRIAPLDCAITIAIAIATALEHAQTQRTGFVHRHLTPSKVLISDDGAIKLGGFGMLEDRLDRTMGYQSPEQCVGPVVDLRSDVFSLGVVLYELTTGVRLFAGPTDAETIADIVCCTIPPPSEHQADYPPMLGAIVMRALRRELHERYQSAGEMLHDLEAFQRRQGVATLPSAIGELVSNAGRVASPSRTPDKAEDNVEEPGRAVPRPGSQSMALASSAVVPPQVVRWHQRWWPVLLGGLIVAGLGISSIAVYRMQYAPAPPLYVGRPAPPETPSSSRRAPPPKQQPPLRDAEPAGAPEKRQPAKRPVAEAAKPSPPESKTLSDAAPAISTIDVRGGLPSPMVRKSVEQALPALRACFRTAARGRGIAANTSMSLLFDIDETRAAVNVRTTVDRLLGSLPGCATMAIGKIRTPKAPSPGNAHVYLTIRFRPT